MSDLYIELDRDEITKHLKRGMIDDVIAFSMIDSTNEFCKNLYQKGVRKNVIVSANQQLSGRGRKKRHFESPKNGIYASILYFPKTFDVSQLQFVTICAVLAVCEAVEKHYDIELDIKWLNDVYINEKKIAGILTETQFKGQHCEYLIIGIGMNTYRTLIPLELQNKISSIEKETGILVDRNLVIAEMFNRLFDFFEMIERDDYSFIPEYERRNFLIGRNVTLETDKEEVYKVLSINQDGHLVIENSKGQKILNAEEVSLHGWQ